MARLGKKPFLILLAATAAAVVGGLSALRTPPEPIQQPIEFSHRIHAGDNQIACLYCHTGASRSPVAGTPPLAACYECHRLVKLKNPGIDKVMQHWETKQPIEWVRINSLPDHVYFSHEQHVRAGVACQNCHGEVQQADRVSQQAQLTMGWCLQCHQQRNAPRECATCHK